MTTIERRSAIKPQLINVSSSGTLLNGTVVERNRERANVDIDSRAVKASHHLLVVHADTPARLDWRLSGANRAAEFSPGDAIVNPQGVFVAPRWNADVELLLLAVSPSLVSRVSEELGRHGTVELVPHVHFRDDLIHQLAQGLIVEFERRQPPDRVYAETLMHALVVHLVRHYSVAGLKAVAFKHGLPPAVLARVVEFINESLAERMSLEDLAKVAGLSPSHFVAMFKRSTGVAPHQYVLLRRLDRAKDLLARSRLPIADVAVRTGFADQSHLTRMLRRHTGLTPRLLRDATPALP
ncbi:MAG: helix-turn-helix transcriptional regulator [Acidobacteria bacterium]|nr:helix-turn-helix transcriptional regulator [Acidobacteriota bacterium]